MPSAPCPTTVVDRLQDRFREAVKKVDVVNGQTHITIDARDNLEVLGFLKHLDGCPFEMLSDVTGIDFLKLKTYDEEAHPRFAVVYNLYSLTRNVRLIVRALLDDPAKRGSADLPVLRSSCGVYGSGIWTEREVYEMYGIRFEGHPDLKRLLTPEYFDNEQQYPLRKDYPLRGKGDRGAFPVYSPAEELDMTYYGYPNE